MTGKTYRKKPLEVQAWVFPNTMTQQAALHRELHQHGADLALYDYAVEHSDGRFEDGAYWRWFQAHVSAGERSEIARIGDIIIYDPVAGWAVVSADVFAATHEEVQP